MRTCRCLALGLAVVLLAAPATAAPPAKPAAKPAAAKPKALAETLTGPAKQDYDAGKLLYSDGDYAGSLIKFQAAFDASKDPRLLFNMAACEKSLRHYARAISLLKQYGADTSPLITDRDRAEAADLVKTLEPFTVMLTIDVSEPDAEIEIDDRPVGRSPLTAPVLVDIGQRRIHVRKAGFKDATSTAPVGGSAQQTITVKLEKEIHEGKLSIAAPAGATVAVDGRALDAPKKVGEVVEITLPSGGHTLRVTAPGMRVYEREVVIKDNETRAVEVQLEREAEAERPKLRVAVGCVDAEPRGIDDGLAVYIDGSPTPAVATGGKKEWSESLGRNVVDYVEFPVESGDHVALVRIPGCQPAETAFTAGQVDGGEIHGALRGDSPALVRGPAGNPDWGRASIAVWMPHGIDKYNGTTTAGDAGILRGTEYNPSATGILVQPGLVFRWWMLMLDLGYATGTASLASNPQNTAPEILQKIDAAKVRWLRAGTRIGARFPFNVSALALGVGAGYDSVSLTNLAPGLGWEKPNAVYGGAWALLDIQAFCDWPVHAGASLDGAFSKIIGMDTVTYALQFGAAYQPNSRCRAERSTTYELSSRARTAQEGAPR